MNETQKTGFYYGYVIVIVAFIMMTLSWGVYLSFGAFFQPLADEFGWSRALISGAYSLSGVISGISGIAAGKLSDRFGPRFVIMSATALLSLGYVLMSRVQSAWQFYLIYGFLIAIGLSGFWAPLLSTLARWFAGKRGLMTGIVSGGIGFGSLIFAPAITQVIAAYGWRWTFISIGIFILAAVMLSALFIKHAPQRNDLLRYADSSTQSGHSQYSAVEFSFGEAVRTRQLWLVCLIYFCLGVSQVTVTVHIIPHAVDMGISAISAASIISVIGAVSLGSRLIIGGVADRTHFKISLVVSLILMLTSIIWLQAAADLWSLYLFAFIFGLAYGGSSCLQSLVAARLFGLTSLGVIIAVFSFSFSLGGGVGPLMAGHIYDISQSYWLAFLICAVLMVGALVSGLLLKPPNRKRH